MAVNAGVGCSIWPKFEVIQAFMHVLVTCKNGVIELKMNELECSQDFSHYKSMGIFLRCSRAANSVVLGPIWPNIKFVHDIMDVFFTCKYDMNPIKNEGPRVFPKFFPIITLWELFDAMETNPTRLGKGKGKEG